MTVNTPHDLLVFLSVFISGVCVGVMFDFLRGLRKVYPPGRNFLSFQDAIFCAFAFFIVSHTVSVCADGDLRWYVFAGFFSGIALYFLTVGKFVLLFFTKFFMIIRKASETAVKTFKKLFSCVSKPFAYFFKKIKCVFSSLYEKIRKISKKTLQS